MEAGEEVSAAIRAAERAAGDKEARRWLRRLTKASIEPGSEVARIVRALRVRLGEQAGLDEVRERTRVRVAKFRERERRHRA